jgi:hypothetical protein
MSWVRGLAGGKGGSHTMPTSDAVCGASVPSIVASGAAFAGDQRFASRFSCVGSRAVISDLDWASERLICRRHDKQCDGTHQRFARK